MTQADSPTPPRRRRAEDQEEVYYQGPPALRGHLQPMFTWGISGVVLIVTPVVMFFLTHRKAPSLTVAMISALLGLSMIGVPIFSVRSVRYRISNLRVDWERGLLAKSIDTVELWQLADIKFYQTLSERLLGVGTIELFTIDPRTPVMTLHAVPSARKIFDKLKERVVNVKALKGMAPPEPAV